MHRLHTCLSKPKSVHNRPAVVCYWEHCIFSFLSFSIAAGILCRYFVRATLYCYGGREDCVRRPGQVRLNESGEVVRWKCER